MIDIWSEYINEYNKIKKLPSTIKTVGDEDITPEKFVYRLLTEGTEFCDSSNKSFNEKLCLPTYYDEQLFKRGQKFVKEHLFSFIVQMLFGLLCISFVPVVKVERASDRSDTPAKMYKRLVKSLNMTVAVMDLDFSQKSTMWDCLKRIRNTHSTVSKTSFGNINYGIMQRDMALSIFMFCGFFFTRNEMIGVYKPTKEELKGLAHMWRVFGHFFGVEDKFNICSGNVEETTAIMNIIIEYGLKPFIKAVNKDYQDLVATTKVLKAFNPIVEIDALEHYTLMTLYNTKDINIETKSSQQLELSTRIRVHLYNFLMWLNKFTFTRIFLNNMFKLNNWLVLNFPVVNSWKIMEVDRIFHANKEPSLP